MIIVIIIVVYIAIIIIIINNNNNNNNNNSSSNNNNNKGLHLVRALDLRSKGRGFDFQLMHCQATTLGMLFRPMCLCHQAV